MDNENLILEMQQYVNIANAAADDAQKYVIEAREILEEVKTYTTQVCCYIIEIKELLNQVEDGKNELRDIYNSTDLRDNTLFNRNRAIKLEIEQYLEEIKNIENDLKMLLAKQKGEQSFE